MNHIKLGLKIIFIFIKSQFKCQHFKADLEVLSQDKFIKRKDKHSLYECSCKCKCGHELKSEFWYADWLDPIYKRRCAGVQRK
jgi:hypothetical protein